MLPGSHYEKHKNYALSIKVSSFYEILTLFHDADILTTIIWIKFAVWKGKVYGISLHLFKRKSTWQFISHIFYFRPWLEINYGYRMNCSCFRVHLLDNCDHLTAKLLKYFKRGYFRWGKILRNVGKIFHLGVIFTLLLLFPSYEGCPRKSC